MNLIDNWTQSWRFISMQGAAAVTVLNTFSLSFPSAWAHYVQVATAVLGAMTMYGRLVQQQSPPPIPSPLETKP